MLLTKTKQFLSKNFIYYLVISIIVTIGLFFVLNLDKMQDIAVPFSYSFDSLGVSSDIKNIIDHHKIGSIFYSADLAAPYGYSSFDYYFMDTLLYLFFYFVSTFVNHYGTILNIAYLFSFYIVAWCSFWILDKLHCSKSYSVLGSILYSFLQYHFYRGEDHLALGFYWGIPLICYVLITLYHSDWKNYTLKSLFKNKEFLFCIILCLLLGLWDLYYLVFSIILLFCVGIFSIIKYKNKNQLLATFFLFLSSISFAIPIMLGSFLQRRLLVSSSYDDRSIASIELYGLRLTQLLLPIKGHRLALLNNFRENYDNIINIGTNESSYVSLGFLISLGFIYSIFYLFTMHSSSHTKKHLVVTCGLLNLLIFLISSIGGISSFIGLITSSIRCYNRMVVFIAFFSIIALGQLLNDFLDKLGKWGYLLIIILCSFGIWDQTSSLNVPDYDSLTAAYYENDTFIKQIENVMPEDSMIFELPLLNSTEECINEMEHYALYKPYLHSSSLKWVHRFSAGSKTEQMIETMKNMDIYELLDTIYLLGFDGIYIDALGYTDEELAQLTDILNKLLGKKQQLVSYNGTKLFYSLDNYCISNYDTKVFNDFSESWYNIKSYAYTVLDNPKFNLYKKNSSLYIGTINNSDIITITGDNISGIAFSLQDRVTKKPISYSQISLNNYSLQLQVNDLDVHEAELVYKEDASIKKVSLYSSIEDSKIYADHLYYFGDISMEGNRAIILPTGAYQYGPYLDLPSGSYKIILDGENLQNANVDCVTNYSLDSIPITSKHNSNSQISYTIQLDEDIENIEFRLFNNSSKEITLHYLQIDSLTEDN